MDNKDIKTKLDNKELEEVAGGIGIAAYKKVEPYFGVCKSCKESKTLEYKNGSYGMCKLCYTNFLFRTA